MSTQVPVASPTIPHPTTDPEALYQSVLAIKQNVELAQGVRGSAYSAQLHGPTPNQIAIAAALRKVTP